MAQNSIESKNVLDQNNSIVEDNNAVRKKLCNKCFIEKVETDFYLIDGKRRRYMCIECYRAVARSRRPRQNKKIEEMLDESQIVQLREDIANKPLTTVSLKYGITLPRLNGYKKKHNL